MAQAVKTDDHLLNLFVAQLKQRLGKHLKQLILYGSRARGDNQPDSDYDLMVILDEITPETNDILDELAGAFLYEYGVLFASIAVSETRYKTGGYNPLFMNVKKEGIPL